MKTKKKDLLDKYIPLWAIPPLMTIVAVNCPDLLGKQRTYRW